MWIDSRTQSFSVPQDKRFEIFNAPRNDIGSGYSRALKIFTEVNGEVYILSLSLSGAKYYIREMAAAIGKGVRGGKIPFSPALRTEI